MRYDDAQLLDRLAAEHVLGTLRGAARRRFERLCATHGAARAALHRWEDEWLVLSRQLSPVAPSARVWANVRARLFGAQAPRPGRRRRWQLAAAAASLIAVTVLVSVLYRETHPALQTLAVLGRDSAHPWWRIEKSGKLDALTLRAVGAVEPLPGKAYELWALPRGGVAPVSLGLLPAGGSFARALTATQRAALAAADKVAVSVEPSGGSPTGSPTGPVIIVASLPLVG
jgi:anti-sigma-K factor RskA